MQPASDPTLSDEFLLVSARTDREYFGVFYDRHRTDLMAYFYRRCACTHVSADLTAETFAEALRCLSKFRPDKGIGRQWLYGIAGKQYQRWLRRGQVDTRARRRLGITTEIPNEVPFDHVDAAVDAAAFRTNLRVALAELSPQLREAVVLRVVDELPYQDVAERLGCTQGAARVRVSRGLSQLLAGLEPA